LVCYNWLKEARRVVRMRMLVAVVLAVCLAWLCVSCGSEKHSGPKIEARPALGRVIIIGFDGLEPTMVRKWVAEGILPTFAKLTDEGAFGDLITVLPPSSASAWTSAVTGVNPGKHGIYGFLKTTGGDAGAAPVFNTSRDRGFAPVWEILGAYGRKSYIMNIPLSSPADSLNGLMIAGFPHASDDERSYYWPESLKKILGDYSFDAFRVTCAKNREEKFLTKMQTISARRLDLGLELHEQGGWDLYWLVFTFPDRYQHYLWKYMDENHPMYDPINGPVYKDEVRNAYVQADNYLAEFMRRMKPDDLLVVMSDHGFGHLYYTINSNNFIVRTLGSGENVRCADFFGGKFLIDVSGPGAEERYLSIRNRLIEGLRQLKDPVRGEPIIDSIYVKEDIYTGPYVSTAPDILCFERPGYLFFSLPKTPDLRLLDSGPNPDKSFSGFHKRRGTIGLYGKYVEAGQAIEARIVDIPAIVLSYLGVPAPRDMDGKVPSSVFTDESAGAMELVRSDEPGYRRPTGLNTQDSRKIEKQLRAVGYIQ
jgi:predicted AlkP superfamily phosphohydrolase/phosphomutase